MTEAEWLACEDTRAMLMFLAEQRSDRKSRLLACAWCREVWYQLANNLCRQAVELSERFADDPSVRDEMECVREAAWQTSTGPRGMSYSGRRGATFDAAFYASIVEMWHMRIVCESTRLLASRPGFPRRQRDFVCDIFGNPFRPVAFDPAWRTTDAVTLARQMYESRDFGAMSILADALQDAGCEKEVILNHCREAKQVHVRGCWVVDLVLGKE